MASSIAAISSSSCLHSKASASAAGNGNGVALPFSNGSSQLSLSSSIQVKGFRIQYSNKCLSNSRVVSRKCGLRIVSEAQDTLVDIPAVTDATFQSLVLNSDKPVLVEFWASWCGPCRIMHPVVAEISEQYAGKINFFKLNTDESPSTATKYGIRSVPTMVIFVNGEKRDFIIGNVPKTKLAATIEKFS